MDSIGDVTVTNDGATILKQLEVEHPAAKVLVELAELQDSEVGDGTTSVVILAAELLKRANELVKQRIHPTTIMSGYRLAVKEAVKYIKTSLTVSTDKMEHGFLVAAAKTAMSSKIIGSQNADFFSKLAVDAVLSVKREPGAEGGPAKYPVSSIHIIKSHGRSALESQLVNGFALPATRVSQQMPRTITGARIALLDFNLQRHRMQLGVQVLVTDPAQLEAIRQREADITKEKIAKVREGAALPRGGALSRLPAAAAASPPHCPLHSAAPRHPLHAPSALCLNRSSPRARTSSSRPRRSTTCARSTLWRRGSLPCAARARRT